jgi:pimeloyl-ACP methyl ester carboxylesterase
VWSLRLIPHRALLLAAALVAMSVLGCTPPGVPSAHSGIAVAPTRIAHTALGAVGYRELGHGPTLVLITGYGATMDDWAPYFVNTLATRFRVVVLDNAGVGQTASLPAPLTVPAMAAQTSALITTLGVGPCDVLGWSMGGMVAQSLAVTDPSQVKGLVLAATQAGTGEAVPVPRAAQAALNGGNPAATIRLLFPAKQTAAIQRYVLGIATYRDHYTASSGTRAEQQRAVDRWFAGDDASGRQVGQIQVPTLVTDGTEDALDPVANAHMLAGLIPGSRLVLYPDAGHAFLFQYSGQFSAEVASFLG